jgi:hypothetical protein
MAAGPPLSRLVLKASSVADDLGYVALADVARAIEKDAPDHRIIGGHMITVLAAQWRLGADLYRETGDAVSGCAAEAIGAPDRHWPKLTGTTAAQQEEEPQVVQPGPNVETSPLPVP